VLPDVVGDNEKRASKAEKQGPSHAETSDPFRSPRTRPCAQGLHSVGRDQPATHESGTSTTRNPSGSTSVTPCAFQYGFAGSTG